MIESTKNLITPKDIFSVSYHNIFDFPLTTSELIKWQVGKKALEFRLTKNKVEYKKGYFFLFGKQGLISKRTVRQRISKRKQKIALQAGKILRLIPSVRLVAITGSLAMQNARKDADIDILIITSFGCLWLTRPIAFLALTLAGFPLRRFGNKSQKDKLCLNMWLSEGDLSWPAKDRNFYTSHEIAQIIPIVNKNKTLEKFIVANKWILDYWPRAVKIVPGLKNIKPKASFISVFLGFFEKTAFKIQYLAMRKKITREVVRPTRAIFHPTNWSQKILSKISS